MASSSAPIRRSRPSTTTSKPTQNKAHTLPTDGRVLNIPSEFSQAEYIAVETLQGSIVATYPNTGRIDITQLPKGIYMVKTLNAYGNTQRIGTLMK